jgi:DNA-binding beta-propeller fold protein YncE
MEISITRKPSWIRGRRTSVAAFAAVVAVALILGGHAGSRAQTSSTDALARSGEPCVVGLEHVRDVPRAELWGLTAPEAIGVDHRGDLVIANTGNHRIMVVTSQGRLVREFGGFGWEPDQFDSPSDLSIVPGFFIYVLDTNNRRIQRFDVNGNFIDLGRLETWSGSPVGVEVRRTGEILIVDADYQTVLTITQFAELLEPVGEFGLGTGGLAEPRDVASGRSREIAVADASRATVEVFDEFGTHLYAVSEADTLATEEVLYDRHGNLLVADVRHGRILAYPPGGETPTASLDGRALGLVWPSGLAIDERTDTLYVLDREAPRVLVIEIEYDDCPSER